MSRGLSNMDGWLMVTAVTVNIFVVYSLSSILNAGCVEERIDACGAVPHHHFYECVMSWRVVLVCYSCIVFYVTLCSTLLINTYILLCSPFQYA